MLHTKGRRRFYNKPEEKKFFFINERIRVPEVFVIDENNQALGKMPTSKALTLAQEKELDLIEINPKANPPICKILDFGQFQYQQSRKVQEQKANVKKVDIKGIRLSYKIGQHDLDFRKNQALKFLSKGDKVKIETILRGRERQYQREAMQKIQEFINSLGEVNVEQPIKKMGNQISCLISQKT